jgi:peptidoglycan/xylan/chitin deacetylase (PgdA/CDA1 family)
VSVQPSAVIPVVSPETFAQHLDAFAAFADIVPLADVLSRHDSGSRLRVAVTFDDDDPADVEVALPVLAQRGVRATFFLSGRSLHRLPHYWWTVLEGAVAAGGVEAVGRALGLRGGIADIARACEDPRVAERLIDWAPPAADRMPTAADIRQLAAAGMTIGFHTLRHPVLPLLDDAALDVALTEGRQELADAAGVPIEAIAYPHGRGDERVARAAERHGFTAGFVVGGRGVPRIVDRFRLPRWEPGPLRADDLIGEAMVRVHA